MDQNSKFNYQQSLERIHYVKNDMKHRTQILQNISEDRIEYDIIPNDQNIPAFYVTYNATSEIMKIVSFENNARCALHIPKNNLNYSIKEVSVLELIQCLVELEIEINDNINIYHFQDFECHFYLNHLFKNEKLLNILLDFRYAAIQSQSIY